MADRTGEQFGNYRLLRLIGRGGFADVYLGEHLYLHTQAALKILQVRLVDNALETFLREAQIIVQLEHPHIVRVLECGIEHDIPFLVMSYASGGSLRQRVPAATSLPPTLVSTYITQIANALQYAHNRKFIHRDVKPENMLINQDDQLLLSDFGLVLLTQSTGSQTTKEMSGTIPYMAPEQLRGKPCLASDQYALGIITYELLSGSRPFQGTFVEIASQHLLTEPPPLSERVPGLSRQVEQVVLTALAKRPEERFSSIQAFADALAQAISPTLYADVPAWEQTADATFIVNRRAQTPPGNVFSPTGSLAPDRLSTASQPTGILSKPAVSLGDTVSEPQPVAVTSKTWVVQSSASRHTPVFLPQDQSPTVLAAANAVTAVNQQPLARHTALKGRPPISALLILVLLLLLIVTPILIVRADTLFRPPTATPTVPPTPNSYLTTSTTPTTVTVKHGTTLTPTSGPSNQPTPTPTSGQPPTPTPTSGPSNQPTPTPTSGQPPTPTFIVSNVTASASPSNFHGTCSNPMTFTFTGTISVPARTAGGTVTYHWLRSDEATGPSETVTFAPGVTTQTVTTTWNLGSVWGNGTTFWEAVQVISPDATTSGHANFSFVCQSQPPHVTSIYASVSPGSYNCSQSQMTFNFRGTITLSSNPSGVDVVYVWLRSDGATMSPITVVVPAGQTSITIPDTWTLFQGVANGTYWEKVQVSSPNSFSSNEASVTVSC